MNGICPNCEAERELENVRVKEAIDVKGTLFKVEVNLLKCTSCNETFTDPESHEDPIGEAFQQFRKMNGMITPEEMRDFRQHLGLTQGELGKLLGWGAVTLSRYERGALQDDTHDKALRLAMTGGGIKDLVEASPDVLPKNKREMVLKKWEDLTRSRITFDDILATWCDNSGPDEFNGFQRFDTDKFNNAVLFFAKGGVSKTKLNKLLFYSDFLAFKTTTKSITGTRYCHLPHGPVPDGYDITYSNLQREGQMVFEHRFKIEFWNESGEKTIIDAGPDVSIQLLGPSIEMWLPNDVRTVKIEKTRIEELSDETSHKDCPKHPGEPFTDAGCLECYKEWNPSNADNR